MRWRILRGMAWQGSAIVLARVARSLVWLLLGGVLSPAEFGAFAAIYVVVDGLYLLQEAGLPQAIVVRRDRVEESADSTFLLALALGVLFATLGWLLAPAVASFYGNADLVPPFRILSLVLVMHSLRVVPLRLFERELKFERKVGPTAWGAISYLVVAVLAARAGWGMWSLVAAVIAGGTLETVAYWIISPWRPRGRFSFEVAKEDLRFGVPIVTASVLAYAYTSLDRLALGRWAGADVLGPYAFALTLATVPSSVASSVVNGVLLPSYSGLGDDRDRRRELHFHAIALGAGLNLLFAALVVSLAAPFLHSVYGTKWDAAVTPLQVLVFAGLARALASLTGEFLVGAGHPGSFRTMYIIQLAVAAAAILPAFRAAGSTGVAVATAAAPCAATAWGWWVARGPLGVPGHRYLAVVAPSALAFAAALAAAPATGRLALMLSGLPGVAVAALLQAAVFLAAWWAADARLRGVFARRRAAGGGPP